MSNKTVRSEARDIRFLKALAAGSPVEKACKAACYGRSTVYEWREQDAEFAKAWDEAVDAFVELMEAEADRRGMVGVDEPVFHDGKEVGTKKRYSDTLLIFRLKALRPEKYRERIDAKVRGNLTITKKSYLDDRNKDHDPV